MKLAERSQGFARYRHVRLNKLEVKSNMDKDRIQGSVEQAKGKIKEVAGKVTGDAKLETEGKTQETAGKIQNAVGGFKDTLKEAVED
jgi:uncharacterized protein YjbJ (UPF0337 family)